MIDYAQILIQNYAGKEWAITNNSYEELDWQDSLPKPTKAELDGLWESTQATVAAKAQAVIDTKASALAKLAALGLTQDEVKALIG
jgi:uncharacterized protein (DUF1800 family)